MLVMMYHMLRDGVDYQELGPDYLDKLQPLRLTTYLVKRLESLGHKGARPFFRGALIAVQKCIGPIAVPEAGALVEAFQRHHRFGIVDVPPPAAALEPVGRHAAH